VNVDGTNGRRIVREPAWSPDRSRLVVIRASGSLWVVRSDGSRQRRVRDVDRLFGQQGDDRIDARDGGFDGVGCGPGRDVALADRADLVGVDCERVVRARGTR
jgi:hypothetical protein